MMRWLRAYVVRLVFCLACAVSGAGIGILLDFPNLIAGAFEPGTAFWTPIGGCVGALAGAGVQAIHLWNSSLRT